MKKIDWYIIKKFLGTFFYTLILLLLIIIAIDISENIDEFLEHKLSFTHLIIGYYIYWIPYFGNLLTPLFVFISVIFFTSKMANNSEIIAFFSSGISFIRFLRPFFFSSILIALISFILGNFVIPYSNTQKIAFEREYFRKESKRSPKHIHLEIEKEKYLYLKHYDTKLDQGQTISLEHQENGKLVSKLRARSIRWNKKKNKWSINYCEIRRWKNGEEHLKTWKETTILKSIDTNLLYWGGKLDPIKLKDLLLEENTSKLEETLNLYQLNDAMKKKENINLGRVKYYDIEKHKRIAFPFASIILTLIAVAISSKKSRGGVGVHLGLGLILSFTYILFFQFSSILSINGNLEPFIAIWIPNIIYGSLSIILIRKASR